MAAARRRAPYPEYVSGHACVTGAATSTFGYLFGGRSINLATAQHINPSAM